MGKTKMMQKIIDDADYDSPLLYINMRIPSKPGSSDVFQCLQAAAGQKWNAQNMPEWLQKARTVLKSIAQAAGKQNFKN